MVAQVAGFDSAVDLADTGPQARYSASGLEVERSHLGGVVGAWHEMMSSGVVID